MAQALTEGRSRFGSTGKIVNVTLWFCRSPPPDVLDGWVLETVGNAQLVGCLRPSASAVVPLPDRNAGSGGRISAFDPAHERIGRADARRGDDRRCVTHVFIVGGSPLSGDYSLVVTVSSLGKTPANDQSF